MALSPEVRKPLALRQRKRRTMQRYLSWQVVMMALIGGLILNLMPCVLPVLGMKLGSILW